MRPTSSTILLVQNKPLDVFRLLYAFAQAGHTAPIECTRDGVDAVAQLAGTGGYTDGGLFPTPGLIVIDLDLDDGSGFDILKWVQSSPELAGLPSVVLTSSRRPQDVARAFALGAHQYRVTPKSLSDLCRTAKDIDEYWHAVRAGAPVPAARRF